MTRRRANIVKKKSQTEMVGLLHKDITFLNNSGHSDNVNIDDGGDDYGNYDNDDLSNSEHNHLLIRNDKHLTQKGGRQSSNNNNNKTNDHNDNDNDNMTMGMTSRHSYPPHFNNNDSPSNGTRTPLLSTRPRAQSFMHAPYIQDDINEDNFADQFLNTVDNIEDEFDRNAYEELIPLNIRLELENRLFGWSHLYSEVLGHCCFPLFYYLTTFWLISVIGLKFISSGGDDCLPTAETCTQDQCGWYCTIHKISYHGETNTISPYNKDAGYHYKPIFHISVQVFIFLRQLFSIWAAVNAFRTVRRRRRVWLTTTAAEYFKDKKRKDEIKEVDKKTLLGRMREKSKARKITQKIRKAERRFEKRKKLRSKFITGSTNFENEHHEKVRMYGETSTHDESNHGNEYVLSDPNSPTRDGISQLRRVPSTAELDPDKFVNVYEKYKRDSRRDFSTETDEFQSHHRHFYARTMPTYAMPSINMDQICLKSKFQNIAYAHGGFFGAAPFMLANPHWINILRKLMPDVYVEISRRAVRTPVPQLIHWAENNPVVAAYGTAHALEFSGQLSTLEWDVFLDPHLVQRVEVVLQARDTFLKQVAQTSERMNKLLNRDTIEYNDKMKAAVIILESGMSTRSNESKILEFYNAEIEKRVELLLENMLIAHGNFSQLFLEQTGLMKKFNFSRVKHTRRTLGGGIFAKHWIPTFVQALKMSTKSDSYAPTDESSDDSLSSSGSTPSTDRPPTDDNEADPLLNPNSGLVHKTSFHDLALAAISPSTISESINELKTKYDISLGLILDFKSRHVPKIVWALLLDALRKAGARVEGIASFYEEDIRDISKLCSVPVNEIIFYHSAGDVQDACHNGIIRQGDSVFFNAGSLFWNHPIRGVKDFGELLSECMGSFDVEEVKKQYKLQSYARVQSRKCNNNEGNSSESEMKCNDNEDDRFKSEIRFLNEKGSTIQQYKEHFNLSLGLYVQEFCIDDQILEILIEYVNKNQHIFNLGFSWGGVNGITVKGIQPGRLTSTDGLWNQRYMGKRWDIEKYPLPINNSQIT